jgi:hypothetical protein
LTLVRPSKAKASVKDVFFNQERKLEDRRRLDTVLVPTINDAIQRFYFCILICNIEEFTGNVEFFGSGGSMVAKLKLKGIDGKSPPEMELAA